MLCALVLAIAPSAAAGEKQASEEKALEEQFKQRSKQLEEELKTHTLVARVAIKQRAVYFLTPDGGLHPHAKHKPGKRDLHFSPGDIVRRISVDADPGGRFILGVQCCRGGKRAWLPQIQILFPERLTPEDLQLEKILRGLSGLFEVEGYDPTAAVRGVVEALSEAPAAVAPSAAGPPTVAAVAVRVVPERVEAGESVDLVLEYEVSGGSGDRVEARESRTLRFDGRILPGYPREESFSRSPGPQRTVLSQAVPALAPPGTYELRGEVCVADDCISRVTRFEVTTRR